MPKHTDINQISNTLSGISVSVDRIFNEDLNAIVQKIVTIQQDDGNSNVFLFFR